MILSMTAYGRIERTPDWGQASCEIRSVNHRYLEMNIRLPDELRSLEQKIRTLISNKLKRGKIDCHIRYEHSVASIETLPINERLLDKLIKTAQKTNEQLKQPAIINPLELLRWPGVLDKHIPASNLINTELLKLVDDTLTMIIASKAREGNKIRDIILERCQKMKAIIVNVRAMMPNILNSINDKLILRAQELSIELDQNRLEQELLLLTQKMDITEEIDRLNAHIEEVNHILDQNEPVGRKLDFLMQEMNREANTLGSKPSHLDISNATVELKVLIEQMREQIQNIA